MKKLIQLSFLAIMAISMAFVACKKDSKKDDPTEKTGYIVEAKNVDESISSIANVAAIDALDVFKDNPACIAKDKFQGSGFKLFLPFVLADKDLTVLYPDSLNIKYKKIAIIALTNKNENIGLFSCSSEEVDRVTTLISYVYYGENYQDQRSFSYVSQGITWNSEIDCNYKKGWNIEYFTIDYNTYKNKTATQAPAGVSYSWMFLPTKLEAPASMQTPEEIYAKELKMRMQR